MENPKSPSTHYLHRFYLLTLIGIVCTLAASCKSNKGDGTSDGILAGTMWRLLAWPASSSDPSRFTITADFSEAQISGTSAVNSYSGPYTATGDGRFLVGDLQSTLMGGSDEAMRAESLYFDLLRQARKYLIEETMLILSDDRGNQLLVFNRK